MNWRLDLTDSELKALNDLLAPQTFDNLVEQWRSFVHSIADYRFSIYDYDNDVSVRERIEECARQSDVELRTKILLATLESDLMFLESTQAMNRSHYSSASWHSRLPSNPVGELLLDVTSGNL
ncbi:MAG TPA: hypothetical protein PKA27_03400 [Fimbriimonadaceae bacterium]|nr:hypothetical protein [Fimbriimonadaceae bacterium]